eukprot:1161610-Pelagomonas_calceolata.AAC.2
MLQQCRHQVQGTHKCWGCQPACKGRCIRGGLEGDQQGGHGAAVSKQCCMSKRRRAWAGCEVGCERGGRV